VDAFVYVLKSAGRPASVEFLVIVLGVGIALATIRRTAAWARWYFGALFVAYWVFATPACAERLVRWSGDGSQPLAHATDAHGARVVVVLGSGNQTVQAGGVTVNLVSVQTALRVVEGARLYKLLDRPTVIVSGGVTSHQIGWRPESESMRDVIVRLGVAPDHVVLESESKTTREEALIIRRLLHAPLDQPIVLVTSPTHMRRAVAVFRSVGFNCIPSASAYKSDHAFEELRFLPSDAALLLSDLVLYDTAAWLYYQARGWVGPPERVSRMRPGRPDPYSQAALP
jgi:uncharacterized SAM-binding protein YcdF (DUF218 family)